MSDDPSVQGNSKSGDYRFEGPTFIDPLTGLTNRYYLDHFFPEEIKKAALSNYPLTVLMVDLDGFKNINDEHGHLCGDKVLMQVSEVLKKSVRQTDMVVRYAGDEFIILLPGAGAERAVVLCNKILEDIKKSAFTGDKLQKLHLTLSIGYSLYPDDTQEQVKLIDMADKALYLSKKRGRNRYSSAKEVTMEETSSLIAMDSFPCREFINQQQAFGAVKNIFDKVIRSRSTQTAFVSGSSGVGKSRMIGEMMAYFKDKGCLIYCDSSSTHAQDPYHLFAKGIGAYLETMNEDDPRAMDILSKVPLSELTELSLVIPWFRKVVKKPADSKMDNKEKRFLLFRAFVDLLVELDNVSSPVIMIFDDIQWADKASLELLRYLMKQEANRSIFIICAFSDDRSGAGADNAAAQGLLKEVMQSPNVTGVRLENLSLKDTAGLIDAIFPGVGRSGKFVDLIYATTKGNPSFVEETLKSLVETGIIFYQNKGWQIKEGITGKDIPASLEEIIKGRIKNLDGETKEMILQAAVMGQNFQTDVLRKIGDKNESFVSELIDRAKDMRLVDDLGKAGKYNFVSKDIQNILYDELDEAQRDKIHYKIAQALADSHKDDIYGVAGEAAFHYNHAPGQKKAADFGKTLLSKAAELFDPDEITEYLAQLAQNILLRKENIPDELNERTMGEAVKFILFFQGAIKKFRIYPLGNSVRANTLKDVCHLLNVILAETDCLMLSEVEKSLVINGKRLSFSDATSANAEEFLNIMMDHGIKTISFKNGIQENEMNFIVDQISESPKDIVDKGGWAKVIAKDGIKHIAIDELRFVSVDDHAAGRDKKKFEDYMLIEFLLGKIDKTGVDKENFISEMKTDPKKVALAIMDIRNAAMEKDATQDEVKVITSAISKLDSEILGAKGKGRDNADVLARVISELEPGLRNKVFRSFLVGTGGKDQREPDSAISDDFLIGMITDEYKQNMDNPLIATEFMDDVLLKGERRKEILSKLESRLSGLDINKKDLAFVSGKIRWEDLSSDRRIEMLLRLPDEYYNKSVLLKINDVLEDLDYGGKKEILKNTISRFLIKAKKVGSKAQEDLLGVITAYMEEPLSGRRKGRFQRSNRIDCLLEKLEIETDHVICAYLLEVVKKMVNDLLDTFPESRDVVLESKNPEIKNYYLFIDQLLYMLLKRLKSESESSPVYKLIKGFILDISTVPFLELLVYCIIDDDTKNRYDIRDLYLIVKDKFIDTLINLAMKKSESLKDAFKEYLARRKIAGLLLKLKDVSLDKIRKVLSETKSDPSVSLIESIGYFKDEKLTGLILPFLHHADPAMRMAAIRSLGEGDGQKNADILAKIAGEEKDANIRALANAQLNKLKKKIPPPKE